MTKLSPFAQSALNRVREKHTAYKIARETISLELANELERRLESHLEERDIAVRLADEAGVPRTQIGKAMGTTNYRTVQDILERSSSITVTGTAPAAPSEEWKVTRTNSGWSLTLFGFGPARVSGNAIVENRDGELATVDGDEFIVSNIYRAGIADEVLRAIS